MLRLPLEISYVAASQSACLGIATCGPHPSSTTDIILPLLVFPSCEREKKQKQKQKQVTLDY